MPDLQPKVVLGIAAHPDDLDFGAGGTMAQFAENGADVHYVIITDGSKGTERRDVTPTQLSEIREEEQRAAVKIINGKSVSFLGYPDGELEITMDLKKELVRAIREIKPDVVVTMDPSMLYNMDMGFINHPDHRAAGQATLDAVFPLARDHMSFPSLDKDGLKPHKTKTVLLINFTPASCNYYVDIADTIETKLAAIQAHSSQVGALDEVRAKVELRAQKVGKENGSEFAESFMRIDIP